MARHFSASQVISMVFETPADAGDSEDEFEGYVDDEEMMEMMRIKDESSENNGNEDMDETENYEWDGTRGGIGNENASIATGMNNNYGTPNANSSVTQEGNTPQDFFNSLVTGTSWITSSQRPIGMLMTTSQSIPSHQDRGYKNGKKAFGVNELIQFFSMLIIMGIIHYPRLDEY